MDLVYLDFNCFQRMFDNQSQVRIQLETIACLELFSLADKGKIDLCWSFIHQDENLLCPIMERQLEADRLSKLCSHRIGPNKKIYNLAKSFIIEVQLGINDALHLACAVDIKAGYFVTCDDILIKRSRKLELKTNILNPVDYIQEIKR